MRLHHTLGKQIMNEETKAVKIRGEDPNSA